MELTARSRWSTLHRYAGWATMVVFLATGMYMRLGFRGVPTPDLAHHVFFRSRHLYLLAASLAQLLMGAHLASVPPARPHLQAAASLLVTCSPVLFLLGFATEHGDPFLRGLASSFGWYLLLAGVLLHLLAQRPRRAAAPV
ncbi:MAG TPA: hypothetical protein VGV61_08645 [Thermoanaerobaculia bacterium]|nr:hypothetical protein [Thermoanaerobaculia bacterium]